MECIQILIQILVSISGTLVLSISKAGEYNTRYASVTGTRNNSDNYVPYCTVVLMSHWMFPDGVIHGVRHSEKIYIIGCLIS